MATNGQLYIPRASERLHIDTKLVAQGGMADVFSGIYQRGEGEERVAVKAFRLLREQTQNDIKRRLPREAKAWLRAEHDHVLKFYGICDTPEPVRLALVSPWMKNGNVNDYKEVHNLGLSTLLLFAQQAADGLKHLHRIGIVHGDLKGDNLLVDDAGQVKITDFGRSFVIDEEEASHALMATTKWTAPEILKFDKEGAYPLSKMSDVWAFGITVLELFDGSAKLWGVRSGKVSYGLIKRIVEGETPKRDGYPQTIQVLGLWDCLAACWHYDPEARVNVDDLLVNLLAASVQA